MCGFAVEERKKIAELRRSLGLEAVSCVIMKGGSRRLGRVECKLDSD